MLWRHTKQDILTRKANFPRKQSSSSLPAQSNSPAFSSRLLNPRAESPLPSIPADIDPTTHIPAGIEVNPGSRPFSSLPPVPLSRGNASELLASPLELSPFRIAGNGPPAGTPWQFHESIYPAQNSLHSSIRVIPAGEKEITNPALLPPSPLRRNVETRETGKKEK